MVDVPEFERWFATAEDAAGNARRQSQTGSHHWACFMAEQATQLAAKGLLHGLGRGAWGHDLAELGRRLASALEDELPDQVQEALLRLSRHYIATRYPDAHPAGTPGGHYSASDAEAAIADMTRAMDFMRQQWEAILAAIQAEEGERPVDAD